VHQRFPPLERGDGAGAGYYCSPPMTSRSALQLGLLSLACLLAVGSCAESPPPDVVVIVLDTVRVDHLSCYGYSRRTTPNLDALAAGADRYTLARSTAPWTLPSHASLFTGLFPFQHHADAYREGDVVLDARPLSAEATTLAEVLSEEGFATGAFAANVGYLQPRLGLHQGFAKYVCQRHDAPVMSQHALEWLDDPTTRRPSFLFVNYMDAHRKYNNAPLDGARAGELPAPPPEGESSERYLDELCQTVLGTDQAPSPELVRKTIDAYDLALANLDAGVGQLIDGLKQRGRFDDALIVICSDHGEYFGEHDLVEHSKDVYETAVRIPLIVKRPGQKQGRVIDEPISIADVPRIVLAACPEELAARHLATFPGSARVGAMLAQINYTRDKDLRAPWGPRFQRERAAIYEGRYKLIRSTDGRHELYDLAADPGEEHNLFLERAGDAQKLMQRLESVERSAAVQAQGTAREPTPQELKELRELGYVGDAPPASKKPGE
jgi:arylsulfatase A-like enzyme